MIDTRQIYALKQRHPHGCPEAVDLLCQAIADACNLATPYYHDETAQNVRSALVSVKSAGGKLNPHLLVTLASCVWRLTIKDNKLVATYLHDI